MPRQGHIFEGERVQVRGISPAVAQAAGLRAQSPIPAAAPDDRGKKTLAAVTHTQRAVSKDFNFNGGMGANVRDRLPGQFSRQYHPAQSQISAPVHTVQIADGHLGGGMDRKVGYCLAKHPQDAQILHQHRVRAQLGSFRGNLRGAGQLPVGDQSIKGEVDFNPPQMAIRNRRRKLLLRKVLCIPAGVKVPISKINSVSAGLNGGGDRLGRSGGS
ncbi:hypothetical protein SDC9_56438 [bioreactor metagenome]|uniref:Uncharacterized protein n=1 Tax=bioreactor metagenome TaxID=1076179 RepID=A0A644X7I6_9ZZZZ